jgi:hypothetical protein
LAPVQVLKSKSHSSTLPIKSAPKLDMSSAPHLKHSFLLKFTYVLVLESLNNPIKMGKKVQFFHCGICRMPVPELLCKCRIIGKTSLAGGSCQFFALPPQG